MREIPSYRMGAFVDLPDSPMLLPCRFGWLSFCTRWSSRCWRSSLCGVAENTPLERNPVKQCRQERIRLSERVQAGLRAQGQPKAAVRREWVLGLRQRGLSMRQIAAETGVSAMTVQRILQTA